MRSELHELQKVTDEIVIVGASLGAAIAIHLAHEDKVKALVLIGYPRLVYRQWLLKIAAYFLLLTGIRFYTKSKKYREDESSIFNQGNRKYDRVPALSTLRLFSFVTRETDFLLQSVNLPTLIIQSDKDGLVKPNSAHYVYRHIGSEIKQLTWVHEPHHRLHLGRSRDEIYNLLEDFINKHTTS